MLCLFLRGDIENLAKNANKMGLYFINIETSLKKKTFFKNLSEEEDYVKIQTITWKIMVCLYSSVVLLCT